jgi:hypothetical protein
MNNQRIPINELLNQLNSVGQPADRNQMVPVNAQDECRIVDEDSLQNRELSQYVGDAPEIDLNAGRNAIKQHRFYH